MMLLATARSCRDSARARLGQLVAATTALALAAAGCSYHSTYVAPTDGRARVVWGSDNNPAADLTGISLPSECTTELQNTLEPSRLQLRSHVEPHVHAVDFWVPRYYGPPILIVRPGFAPFLPRPPLFVPTLIAPPLHRPGSIASGLGSVSIGSGRISGGSGIRTGGGGSSNLGGGKEAGAIVLILLVIAATTLPAVALGLAASTPESGRRTAKAIDLVNGYNDLARSQGSPCAAPPPEALAPPPPPYGFAKPEPQP